MVRPRIQFRAVAFMLRSQGTQRSSLSWRVDWRETSESDAETMRKCTPEEIKPECPNAPGMVLYHVHWAETELCSQNSSPHMDPRWCQPWGEFCTRFGRRKWSSTFFVDSVAAGTLPCRFKSPLVWDGSALDLSFPSSLLSYFGFSESWTNCVSAPGLKAPPSLTSYPLRYQDRKWWGRRPFQFTPTGSSFPHKLKSQFFFPTTNLANPSEFRLNTRHRHNRPHSLLPSYHPCGNSPLHNKSVCLAHRSCSGQALADTASTVMDQLLLCAQGGTIAEAGSSAWHVGKANADMPRLTAKHVFPRQSNEKT